MNKTTLTQLNKDIQTELANFAAASPDVLEMYTFIPAPTKADPNDEIWLVVVDCGGQSPDTSATVLCVREWLAERGYNLFELGNLFGSRTVFTIMPVEVD